MHSIICVQIILNYYREAGIVSQYDHSNGLRPARLTGIIFDQTVNSSLINRIF
jgi:hypothetical protein